MLNRPNILLTNDDGVHAPGIKHLFSALKDFANITIVAPADDQSAKGMSITIRDPLHIEEIFWEKGVSVYSATGTPADCIKLAISVILDSKPDLILSGINRGTNAGGNVLYSGTVGGAIEGVLKGIPSIAFSCHDLIDPDYALVEKYVLHVVKHAMEHPLRNGTLLNVNFPSKEHREIKGFKMTRQGKGVWAEDPLERMHPHGDRNYYWLGAKIVEFDEVEDCDITWLKKGFATAVPIHVGELTDHDHLNSRKHHFDSLFTDLDYSVPK